MPCPKDGSEYIEVEGERTCPKCGHVAGYKKVNIVEVLQDNRKLRRLLEDICECDSNLEELIERARKLIT